MTMKPPEVKRRALRALELDAATVSARAALGCAYCVGDWNWEAGEVELKAAIEADPADHRAYQWRAVVDLKGR